MMCRTHISHMQLHNCEEMRISEAAPSTTSMEVHRKRAIDTTELSLTPRTSAELRSAASSSALFRLRGHQECVSDMQMSLSPPASPTDKLRPSLRHWLRAGRRGMGSASGLSPSSPAAPLLAKV